jgi:hypothetical protein
MTKTMNLLGDNPYLGLANKRYLSNFHMKRRLILFLEFLLKIDSKQLANG